MKTTQLFNVGSGYVNYSIIAYLPYRNKRIPAVGFSCIYCEKGRKWHQKKASKSNVTLATKALSNKLARACYYIIKEQVPYDEKRLYG